MKPTQGFVIIIPEDLDPQKTDSGLYISNKQEDKPEKGRIYAVGLQTKDQREPCKKGDRVIYKKWGGHDIKHEGKEYHFAKFEDILAVL